MYNTEELLQNLHLKLISILNDKRYIYNFISFVNLRSVFTCTRQSNLIASDIQIGRTAMCYMTNWHLKEGQNSAMT